MKFSPDIHSLCCPKCRDGMEPLSHEGVTIDRCTGCEGLWFDGNEADHLKSVPGSDALDSGSAHKGRRYNEHDAINCPHCARQMEKTADWRQTHIWFEICREHGVFMDAGEFTDLKHETLLDKLRSFLKGHRPA